MLTLGIWIISAVCSIPRNSSHYGARSDLTTFACPVLSSLGFLRPLIDKKSTMESARPVYQVLALLWISAFIQSIESHDVSHNVRSVNLSAPETFIESVFDEFGSNNSMNSKQFESLLKELNIGSQSSNEQTSKDKSEAGKQNGESKVRTNNKNRGWADVRLYIIDLVV